MKTFLIIIAIIILAFFLIPVFPAVGQGCSAVALEGQEPCDFHKETGYEYFFRNGGSINDF
ncbi:MAG: hypothetical protein KA028_00460 [Candidatus Pacebacteria bacterium]|nr:hypothetical protein [Candidatus Paceibacterota bacterium]MBP9851976.1 hypothetical protein [Candidatus Paceibacterota bacterium]